MRCIPKPTAGSSSGQESLWYLQRIPTNQLNLFMRGIWPPLLKEGNSVRVTLRLTNGLNAHKTWGHLSSEDLSAGETVGKRAIIETEFFKRKDSSDLLKQHDSSIRHRNCVSAWIDFKIISNDTSRCVANGLSWSRSQEVQEKEITWSILFGLFAFLAARVSLWGITTNQIYLHTRVI